MTAKSVMDWLKATGTPEGVAALDRYGIPNDKAFGVPMGVLKRKAKEIGTDHAAALMLWETGFYEARTMAVFLADPQLLSATQADAWAADFDNWAICDSACFSLLDQTPYRWQKPPVWCADEREFMRRAGFALIWAMTTHDKKATDAQFESALGLVETYAHDARPLVKKAIDMALRAIGKRNLALHGAALETCTKLQSASAKPAIWIGAHAAKELNKDTVLMRLVKAK